MLVRKNRLGCTEARLYYVIEDDLSITWHTLLLQDGETLREREFSTEGGAVQAYECLVKTQENICQ